MGVMSPASPLSRLRFLDDKHRGADLGDPACVLAIFGNLRTSPMNVKRTVMMSSPPLPPALLLSCHSLFGL